MNVQPGIIEYAALIAFGIIVIAMLIVFWRMVLGPSLPDRLLALDFFATLVMGMILTLVFFSKKTLYLDIAVFIALIVFLGTVAVSKFLKRRFYDK